jgi:hypothetical protein
MLRTSTQVISPAEVTGRVVVVPHLSEVQDKVYEDPTVLVVDNVTGERPPCLLKGGLQRGQFVVMGQTGRRLVEEGGGPARLKGPACARLLYTTLQLSLTLDPR